MSTMLSWCFLSMAPSRQAGQRVGPYLEQIITLIMHFVHSEGDDELKESCLQVGTLAGVFM